MNQPVRQKVPDFESESHNRGTVLSVWFQCVHQNIPCLTEVIEQCKVSGIVLEKGTGEILGNLGVVFFNQQSEELSNFITKSSACGNNKVLVVGTGMPEDTVDSWRILASGASDVIFSNDPKLIANKLVLRFKRWAQIEKTMASPLVSENVIGESAVWKTMLYQVIEIARFTDSSILLTGESGTGKEILARLIHTLDSRNDKGELVILDCTTIVPELSGSEFFGHEKGAFTGAASAREGVFAMANKGTLFLDEIGELPERLQAQLLRVIQEGTYKRVGGNNWFKTDFRLICATNRNLLELVKNGTFRNDLYHRIARWTYLLPPLRDRRDDIIPLACHFMRKMKDHNPPPQFDHMVELYLKQREYPGNVRDLKQLVARIMDKYVGGGSITAGDIPQYERPVAQSEPIFVHAYFQQAVKSALLLKIGIKNIRNIAESTAVQLVLEETKGNVKQAAELLGITDRALHMRIAGKKKHRNNTA